MSQYLPLFLGFLGALLVALGLNRTAHAPVGMAMAAVGSILLFVVTLIYLLAQLGVAVFA